MPTLRNSKRTGEPAVSELKLVLPELTTTVPPRIKRLGQIAPKKEDCNAKGSLSSTTARKMQFPFSKPAFRIGVNEPVAVADVSKSTSKDPVRGYDFTSSTNSNYESWAFTVPKQFKRKCSTSTPTNTLTNTKTTPPAVDVDIVETSREMADSQHDGTVQHMNFDGGEWKTPCKESFIAGAPRKFIGTCPLNVEKLAKLSTSRQKFFLTQDPRKTHCLRNPAALRSKAYSRKKEFDTLTKMVKHADNVCAASVSQSSESFICEVIDPQNPMQLDFQGMDYKNTYEKDEQDVQNHRVYRRVCRYMERRRVKAEVEQLVEQELQRERLAVPDCFEVPDRNDEVKSTSTVQSIRYGRLYRAEDKPYNQDMIDEEHQRRHERYRHLYLQRKERDEEEAKQREAAKQVDNEKLATTLAKKSFDAVLQTVNDAFQRSFVKERMLRRHELQRRIFPHTMRETTRLKRSLKICNRIKRDEARVKKEFYLERTGKVKNYPEAELEISSDTPKHSDNEAISEQSTNDEDSMKVGKHGSRFKLRGFQFKLGKEIRGKLHQTELFAGERKEKTCITREQWLAELAPKKLQVKLDVETGVQKIYTPDDPQLPLFPPQLGYKPPKALDSAVHQYVQKRLGRHYDRVTRKNLKLVKPRLKYSVKKFNLISFLYGDEQKRIRESVGKEPAPEEVQPTIQETTTLNYIEAKFKQRRREQDAIKKKRMELLGIPCRQIKKSRLQTLCENSESSSDSDWVPERESDLSSHALESNRGAAAGERVRLPLRMRGNMPAPRYRESTLRRHPRRPRDYLGERVASLLFDEEVRKTGLPHMLKLPEDINFYENVRMQKRPYAKIFEARRHHDHWNATQKKLVDVHYQTKIVKPRLTKVKRKVDRQMIQNFRMANPPCNAFVGMDLTMPDYNIDGMISAHVEKAAKRDMGDGNKTGTKDVCKPHDFIFRSRPVTDFEGLDYPGRREYLNMLHEVRQTLYERKVEAEGQEELYVDKHAYLETLEEDLQSIESCLTSLDSSQCTNLTNDSGSFLLMDGKTKVPLDYIRKSLVPFEELQRSRFQVEPINVAAEDANPFKTLPFSGQVHDQIALQGQRENFFTFSTRLQNGLRLRLEVPVGDVRKKLLGRQGERKYPGAVTTDIDENYVKDLGNRPHMKLFKFKSGRSFIKDALRMKFESMLIQGQTVRTKIYDRLNEQHWKNMQLIKTLYERLFAKWEKQEYDAAMAVVYKVKSFYDITDALKREFRELERQQLLLNLSIVFTEGHWIQRVMLQNFHYLLADQDWRVKHDWIHRVEHEVGSGDDDEHRDSEIEFELENYEESIAKRTVVNIRQREKDDALAIKAFYENVYLQNPHPILIVFPDCESFNKGIENLKAKTFVLLLELHFTLSIHTELQSCLESTEEWCQEDVQQKQEYVERKCAKKYFMEDRADHMKRQTVRYLKDPIAISFDDESFNRDRSVLIEVWREVVPPALRGSRDQDPEPVDMVAMLSDVLLDLLSKFEEIPSDFSRQLEAKIRRRRAYDRKLSKQAYQIERRIESEMKKVVKNLEPPYKRPPRETKLRRYRIKKKAVAVVKEEKQITEHMKLFYRAFHDEGRTSQLLDAHESLCVIDTIQEQIVPFYFDHFLKLNGYTPNYNFKTTAELRDGPEMSRFAVRSVIPEVVDKMVNWEKIRTIVMEENINRNPEMYENVQF